MKSRNSAADGDHMHQIETSDQRLVVDPPKQPVGMLIVDHRIVHGVGHRRRMQMRQRPFHQRARFHLHDIWICLQDIGQPGQSFLLDNLEVPDQDAACGRP